MYNTMPALAHQLMPPAALRWDRPLLEACGGDGDLGCDLGLGMLMRLRLFSLNDYLGLASHPEAATRAAAAVGMGPRNSALVAGCTRTRTGAGRVLLGGGGGRPRSRSHRRHGALY